jgi:hypothetical protein
MILEHLRRLNDVVIDTDQNHVVLIHGTSFSIGIRYELTIAEHETVDITNCA